MKKLPPLALMLFSSAAPAQSANVQSANVQGAGLVEVTTPQNMLPVLKGAGYDATLETGGKLPEASFKYRGLTIYLTFSDCDAGGCGAVNASHGFDLDGGLSLDKVNAWNMDNFSMVYLDKEGDPFIESAYTLTGGVTKTNFLAWLGEYLTELEDFDNTLP